MCKERDRERCVFVTVEIVQSQYLNYLLVDTTKNAFWPFPTARERVRDVRTYSIYM